MSVASAELSGETSKAVQAIVAAGLLASVMDITAAALGISQSAILIDRLPDRNGHSYLLRRTAHLVDDPPF